MARPFIVETGVDYLTVTSRSEEGTRQIELVAERMAAQMQRLGARRLAAGRQGYKGWQVGPLFWGHRKDGAMLDLPGPEALHAARALARAEVKCTRIDVQVTVNHGPEWQGLLARRNDHIHQLEARQDSEVPPTPQFHDGHGKGDSLTFGKRGSPRYLREYEKGVQSGDDRYDSCIRYEVEYRRVAARACLEALAGYGFTAQACAGIVGRQLRDWKQTPPFQDDVPHLAASIGRRDFDTERAIKWLRGQVAPTVERLMATVDRRTIEEALGLELPF